MKRKSKILEWAESLAVSLIVAFVMYFIFWPVKVDGSSMLPTFVDGDRVFISRVLTTFGEVENGDIVVFKWEMNGKKKNLIKRAIGIPGDVVEIKQGKVYINGVSIDEPYVEENNNVKVEGDLIVALAQDEYFFLGDNRDKSSDSRFIGEIAKEKIVGKVIFRIYPFNRISLY